MFAQPVREIEILHRKKHTAHPQDLTAGSPASLGVSGQLFDVRVIFELGSARRVGLDIGGNVVAYDAVEKKLNGATMNPVGGQVSMQILLDRPMIEICGNDGAVCVTSKREHTGNVSDVKAFADGHGAKLIRLEVYELNSIWTK